jgi:hypothetical protein
MQDIQNLVDEIEKSGYLQLVAEDHSGASKDDYVVVLNTRDSQKYKIAVDSILNYDWLNLKRVLDGGEARVIDHITRIVGYYSKTSNWNKSKLGELDDRRKGDYAVREEAVK